MLNYLFKRVIIICLPVISIAQVKSVDFWENRFINSWNKEYDVALPMSLSKDSWQFYNLAYYIDANNKMYQVTLDSIYLDRSILYVRNMINSSMISKKLPQSQYKDNFLGWVNYSAPSYKNDKKEYALFESYCWRYVSDLLFIMKRYGSLLDEEKYKGVYNEILDFTINNIYNKWIERGRQNLYRSNTHMMAHWVKISMNLYLITEDEKYKKIVDDFLIKFRRNKFIEEDVEQNRIVKWRSSWNNKGFYQDVGHGNAVIDLYIDLYENNLGVNFSEIEEFIELFDSVIWKSETKFSKYIDGTGQGSGWFTDGFIKLGRYSSNLQRRIEKHNRGRTTQFFANGAYNAKKILEEQCIKE